MGGFHAQRGGLSSKRSTFLGSLTPAAQQLRALRRFWCLRLEQCGAFGGVVAPLVAASAGLCTEPPSPSAFRRRKKTEAFWAQWTVREWQTWALGHGLNGTPLGLGMPADAPLPIARGSIAAAAGWQQHTTGEGQEAQHQVPPEEAEPISPTPESAEPPIDLPSADDIDIAMAEAISELTSKMT